MKYATWNIRGLNEPLKQAEVKRLLAKNNIDLAGIIETRVRFANRDKVWRKMNLQGWDKIHNYTHSDLGKIWIIYDRSRVKVSFIDSTDQMIRCSIESDDNKFTWTVIYGSNHLNDRQKLWHKITDMSRNTEGAWIVHGDFNAIMNNFDRLGGNNLDDDHSTELLNCITAADITELRTEFGEDWIGSLLMGTFVTPSNMLTLNPSPMQFLIIVPSSPTCITASARERIVLNSLTFGLSTLSLGKFLKINGAKVIMGTTCTNRSILEKQQIDIQRDPSNHLLIYEERAMAVHFRFLLSCEESFYKQKSRIQWLNLGDSNTKYFHNSVKQRRITNCIPLIKLEDGSIISSKEEIHKEITRFYSNLFRREDTTRSHIDSNRFRTGITLTDDEGTNLQNIITEMEVKNAVFSIGCDKAACPDGFNGHFFKVTWDITKDDLVKTVQEAFNSGTILRQLNSTTITVIPKTSNADSLSDFKPSACCNVLYKIISKVITNRLSPLLCKIVAPNQSAFVPNRSIAYNIMLAHELVKNYHTNKEYPRCLLKIHLKKAYDSISWYFIEEILISLNFPDKFIALIMSCMKTPSYYIAWNGCKGDRFHYGKGLRQGDPISPSYFSCVWNIYLGI
ncbi:uncharacterized protein LOC126687695 [Mercurialis annua]|uniref:uncharacterized protein LOC126687695 n=1 Tax=Mercurialis annua TaxID=3986 RepID=UPI00215FCACC|nr:uncharacterized protein LOC126687695 [Mercurialis annua]